MACHVTCDVTTCQFSDWMEWSSCSERCGGVRTRLRVMEGKCAVGLTRLGCVIFSACTETVSRVGMSLETIKNIADVNIILLYSTGFQIHIISIVSR